MELSTSLLVYLVGIPLIYSLARTIFTKNYTSTRVVFAGGGGGGKMESAPPAPPPPPPPPPAPTEDAEVVRQRAEDERRRAAAAKGYSSTDMTNGVFASGNSTDVPKKPTLLGG